MIALVSDLASGELAVWAVLAAITAALWRAGRREITATWREAGRIDRETRVVWTAEDES